MLPAQHKLTSPVQFRRTIRRGERAGTRTLVLHVWNGEGASVAHWGGPRFGLVVSKAVGNAVLRHRVSRRLRHACMELAGELCPGDHVVVRALPAAAQASSSQLTQDMRRALRKLARKSASDAPARRP
ncbi:ribonuclease P protein component [Corynebacterium mastitidis]|uniref:ribonuclease P protein component n=1 Tax=Corynebacterium mastitidis TaxID=161890 RepID=UPI00254A00DF|nr:ribonuclease P protein component [Corynebacterium mastitidis]MDK8450573.1 ribonuclease P protein component [Corynebacterium mastitidis]